MLRFIIAWRVKRMPTSDGGQAWDGIHGPRAGATQTLLPANICKPIPELTFGLQSRYDPLSAEDRAGEKLTENDSNTFGVEIE